jgi:hypothetical protein
MMGAAASKADPKYKPAYEGFVHPEDGADKHTLGLDWSKAPRALLEQAPGLAAGRGHADAPQEDGHRRSWADHRRHVGLRSPHRRQRGPEARYRCSLARERRTQPSATRQWAWARPSPRRRSTPSPLASSPAPQATQPRAFSRAAGNVLGRWHREGATNAAQDLISQGAAKAGTNESIDLKDTLAQGVLGTAGGGVRCSAHGQGRRSGFSTRGTDYGDALHVRSQPPHREGRQRSGSRRPQDGLQRHARLAG